MSTALQQSLSLNLHAALLVGVMSATTIFLRALPFLVFRDNKKTPRLVLYLGRVLPHAIVGMLVIYCLKDVEPMRAPYGLPELLAGILVILLQKWKRNSLVSILAGTLIYMVIS